jgi:hypothetical protein
MKTGFSPIVLIVVIIFLSLPKSLYGMVIEKKYFSLDLPDGWIILEEDGDINIVFTSPPYWQGVRALISITTQDNVTLTSEEFADMNVKIMREKGYNLGEPIKVEEGYYIIPILTNPGGFLLLGIKDKLLDYMMIFNLHPEQTNILKSINILETRPYLSSMSKLAYSMINSSLPHKKP